MESEYCVCNRELLGQKYSGKDQIILVEVFQKASFNGEGEDKDWIKEFYGKDGTKGKR